MSDLWKLPDYNKAFTYSQQQNSTSSRETEIFWLVAILKSNFKIEDMLYVKGSLIQGFPENLRISTIYYIPFLGLVFCQLPRITAKRLEDSVVSWI